MRHTPRVVDVAVGLGSHDLGVAAHCAALYHAGLFKTLLFTGGNSPGTLDWFPRGEATHFREHALALGVPDEAIVVEPDAANTGENIAFSRDLLAAAGVVPRSVLLVSKPYMERRAYATARKLWPEVEVTCASVPLGFDAYVKTMGDEKLVVDMMVGDLQRVIEYPKRGYAVEQDVPEEVLAAFASLVDAGYDGHLLGEVTKPLSPPRVQRSAPSTAARTSP
ncbi:YdcF family protein [Streptomyces liangshanensis]|uniref:YdcF family protein n=1 Tax=Streptomyces liangshanensis TaxID=2717324 RepID=A0A6G9H9Z8_9ACTN|nr:YdcF family protein [Streptomyces liangshanensis]QIQ07031.1 YdcF family protein [Streptomyces liangshanensis]